MSAETILTNARVVTLDAEFEGTVVIRDGRIVEDVRRETSGGHGPRSQP